MGDKKPQSIRVLRFGYALIATGSFFAVLLAILVNVATTTPSPNTALVVSIALGSIVLIGLTLKILVEIRQSVPPDLEIVEESAIRRIQALLSQTELSTDRLIDLDDLQVSVVARRDSSASEPQLQILSAFVAKLTSDPRCTIITGSPGSGKSTMLLSLATRMVEARMRKEISFTPLLLRCNRWSTDLDFVSWVGAQAARTYGIPQDLTRSWMNRGTVLLILDDLDEIPDAKSSGFVTTLNHWLNSAVGGRAVLACGRDSYLKTFRDILHDQVANVEPLPWTRMRGILSRLTSVKAVDSAKMADVRPLLELISETDAPDSSLSTPLVARLLIDALRDMSNEPRDPLTARKGDREAALESYLAIAESPASQLRSLAGIRASILLAQAGSSERALQVLARSLASEIERPLRDPLKPITEHLSDDERIVLDALPRAKSLDAFQISSLVSITPSRCNEALRRLRDRGLVDVIDEGDEPRFRRSSAELIDA